MLKMIYKSSHINYLDRSELEYELNVRGFEEHSALRMEDMRKKLRKYLKKERSGTLDMPSAVGDEGEVEICREKMKEITHMFNRFVLPPVGTDVPKLKRKLEALIHHNYQRIERIATDHDIDKSQLSQEIKSIIQRYEALTHQPLQGRDSDLDKTDFSSGDNQVEDSTHNATGVVPQTKSRPTVSSSEDNAKSELPGRRLKKLNLLKKMNQTLRSNLRKEKRAKQPSLSDTDSSEGLQKLYRRKKNRKNKKKNKKRTRRLSSSSSSSSSSNSSSEEDCTKSSNKTKLKSTPVRFWNLKFSGDDNTSVGAFLADVEDRRVANHMSFRELFNAAGELFSGSALVVYRSCRGRIDDWQGLETKLRSAFQDPDYDRRLLREIENRKQGSEETVTVYIAKMRSLFSRLTRPKPEEDMLDIIEENLLPEYHSSLCLQDFRTIDELEIILHRLEKARLRAQRYDTRPQRSLLEPDLAYKPRIRRDNIKISTMETSRTSDDKNQRRSERTTKTSLTCWNCRKTGHVFADCFQPKTIFCYGCGKENIIKSRCPSCRSKTTNNNYSENFRAERQTSGYRSAQNKTKTD